ncbi:unnamed protein product [Schistosoma rodhaini]|uniref:Tetraspanin n=1 Tax=Schistosoma rodhaini TaxID=6188 RepID=A0AA85EUA6_9TREM|nr:unnamed protein product [Schistosoma rodhaini]CAH8491690.1 unnamed protein product [Schistosoma rodhaini]
MCTVVLRLTLLLINALVGLSALIVSSFGAILTWGKETITRELDEVIGPMIKKMYDDEVAQDFTDVASAILQLTSPFGLILFILGLVALAICLFGFCGASCKSILCLRVYIGLLLVLIVIEITAMSFYYTNRETVFKLARNIAYKSLQNYRSVGSNNTDSILYSVIMPTLNCCGLLNGSDFDNSPNFQRQVLFNQQNFDLKYPIPCCKMDAKFVVLDPTCPGEFNSKNSNIHEGCWTKLRKIISFYGGLIMICGLIVILFQLLLVIGTTVILTTGYP